jgi:hypothetical protein
MPIDDEQPRASQDRMARPALCSIAILCAVLLVLHIILPDVATVVSIPPTDPGQEVLVESNMMMLMENTTMDYEMAVHAAAIITPLVGTIDGVWRNVYYPKGWYYFVADGRPYQFACVENSSEYNGLAFVSDVETGEAIYHPPSLDYGIMLLSDVQEGS